MFVTAVLVASSLVGVGFNPPITINIPPPHLRTTSGFAGKARNVAEAPCFVEGFGSVTNACSGGMKEWFIPLNVDWAGTYAPVFSVYAASPLNTIGCRSIAMSADGATAVVTQTEYPKTFGSPTLIAPPSVRVPWSLLTPTISGTIYGYCEMYQGSWLYSVSLREVN